MLRTRVFLPALCAALLGAAAAQATTLARMSLDELVRAARVVVRARCLSSGSDWQGGEIWTRTRFEVLESFKGSVPQQITVRLIGGRVGHIVSRVAEVPRFRPGEEVVLFLEPTAAGELSVTGWAEGTFRIARDARSGTARVTQDTAARAVFDPATRSFLHEGIRAMPLELFRQRLAAELSRRAGGSQP